MKKIYHRSQFFEKRLGVLDLNFQSSLGAELCVHLKLVHCIHTLFENGNLSLMLQVQADDMDDNLS